MATYFWVGGAGTWNNVSTTNWASSTGGAGGAGVPNNADTANFDANSGTGTVSVAATAVSLSTTFNSANINLSLTGSPTLCTSAGTFTFTQGTLTLNTFTLTCGRFSSSNANARTIAFGTGNITLTGNNATIWTTSTVTNFSVSGTPVINATYSGSTGTRRFDVGAANEANAISVNISAGSDIIDLRVSAGAYKNLIFTGFSGSATFTNSFSIFGNLIISSGMTLNSGTSTITFAATSGVQNITSNGKSFDNPLQVNAPGATVQLQDNLTMGSTRTFTLTAGTLDLSVGNRTLSTGLFSSTNSNTRAILFGTGNITVTGNAATVWTTSTATNFSYTGTSNVIFSYAGSTGTRTITPNSTNAVQANVLNMYVTAGTDIVNISGSARFNTFDLTGFAGTLTSTSTMRYFQDLVFSSGMTLGSTGGTFFFVGTSRTQKVTTAGKAINNDINIDAPSSTIEFQDALTNTGSLFTIVNGTVQLKAGVTSTVNSFVANNSNVKFLQSTTPGSQATLSQASGTVNVVDLTIRDINAVGGASWNAYTDFENTDAGNNDGWNFSLSPPYSTAELPVTLRPFTQPRRF